MNTIEYTILPKTDLKKKEAGEPSQLRNFSNLPNERTSLNKSSMTNLSKAQSISILEFSPNKNSTMSLPSLSSTPKISPTKIISSFLTIISPKSSSEDTHPHPKKNSSN